MAQTPEAPSTLQEILSGLTPTPPAYLRAARQLENLATANLKPANVALVSTFTTELLKPYLAVESARRGLRVNLHFAPYNQLEQQLLAAESALYSAKPDVIIIAARLEDLAANLANHFVRLSSDEVVAEIDAVTQRFANLLEGIRRVSSAKVLVFNFSAPANLSAGLADAIQQPSQTSAIQQLNDHLAKLSREHSDVYIFDNARMVTEFGRQRWQDPKLLFMGRIPWRLEAQIETARQLSRYLRALYFPPCKCLVLDLDNTLWGGVLGEEGIGGIALGEDFPGNVYKDFQRQLAALRDRGILLAIASKNNEADVIELFEKHADCVLRLADFAAHQIHWNDKPGSLLAIARELNIGTDALAFFDDNPVERELVRSQLPEVTVIDVPKNPLEYADAIHQSGAFDALTISREDRKRHEMYEGQRQRQLLQTKCVSTEDFLRELATVATIGWVNSETLERVTQLLGKTNQFNLTTRRHSAAQIQEMIAAGGIALWLRVADKFGDNGLVGVAIAVPENPERWRIDTFLLSCRVIGRKAETALLSVLVKNALKRGAKEIEGEYLPTAKNGLASEFYPQHGFQPDGTNRWKRVLSEASVPLPDCIQVVFADASLQ